MANRYWVGNGGSWNDTAHWSTSSGGAGGASVPGDGNFGVATDVIFDANSFSSASQTVTIGTAYCVSLDFSAVTNNPTIAGGAFGNYVSIGGLTGGVGLKFSANMTITYTGGWNIYGNGTTGTIDFAGKILPDIPFENVGPGRSLVDFNRIDLASNIDVGNRKIRLMGTINTNNFNISSGSLELLATAFGTTTVSFGTSNIYLEEENVWDLGIFAYYEFVGTLIVTGTPTVYIADPSSYTVYSDGLATGSMHNFVINSGTTVTFNLGGTTINSVIVNLAPITLKFQAGSTTTIATFTTSGSAGSLTTIRSTTNGSTATLSCSSVTVSYVDVKDNTAAGAAIPFDASTGGVDSGHNFNWLFPGPSVSPSLPDDSFLQTAYLAGSDLSGDIQIINKGKSDDENGSRVPIYYELETQNLEFDKPSNKKRISDKFGVLAQNAADSKIQIKLDKQDFKDINIDLGKRVNTATLPQLEAHEATLRWSGHSTTKSPILEGFYFNKVEDKGII